MSNIAIIYKSKTGYTKKYAQWLSERTGGDLLTGNINADNLKKYDTIIYGGGLYAGKINGIKLITKNYNVLKDKKIIVYCVCLSPSKQEVIDKLRKDNFKDDMNINFFMLRGGFDYSKCTSIDKFLMNILKAVIKNKKEKDAEEKSMLAAFEKPIDMTNIKNIEPILDSLN